ncbi:MAG: ribosome silencing factor [Coriobacteriia bacterium]|nr:ribosome silencing factor [Coriobacteriia bacterium]
MEPLEIEELVRIAAHAAADKKAVDVVAIRVAELLVITDYFLIATGASDRQVGAVADGIEDALREAGVKPIGREGEREQRWILLDYGDFVVHVFRPDEREFYRLEKLWSDAPRLDLPADVVNASRPEAPSEDSAEGPSS